MQYHENADYSEKQLYELSRSLKFRAREKRKARLEKELEDARGLARLKEVSDRIAAEDEAKQKADRKLAYDARVRKMLVDMANTVKSHGFAFEGPEGTYGWSSANATGSQYITFIDTKPRAIGQDMAHYTFGKKTTVKTTHNGFHWD